MTARLMTIKQVMDACQISRSTVNRLIAVGALTTVKIGKSVRIPVSSCDDLIEKRTPAANDNEPGHD